jgi:ferredoxin
VPLSGNHIHYSISYVVAFLGFGLIAKWYLWPAVKDRAAKFALTPLLFYTETSWLSFQAPRDFIFQKEIAELESRNSNLRVTVSMGRPGNEPRSGAVGHIDAALLASVVPDIKDSRAHICGPPQMMDAVKAALVELGVPGTPIKTGAFSSVKRNPTVKGTASTEVAGKVVFQASDTTAPVSVDATILNAADDAGVFIDNACRLGTCGSCRVKPISGNMSMAVQDALTEQDKAEGYILTCKAEVRGDVKVDA